MAENEIDYSNIPSPSSTPAEETWEPPPHKYFGPKDPKTGKRLPEPVYVHQEFPRTMYAKQGEKIIARLVRSQEEVEALGQDWKKTPGELGYIGAPSFEQAQAMKKPEEPQVPKESEPERRPVGRPKKVA
jgi:hypothetical protein